jgi:hypothetical protein
MAYVRGLVACAAVACLFLRAPSAQAEDGTFGIAAGATASMFPPPGPGETIRLDAGFAIGFYGVIPILKSVSLMPELLYVQKYSERTAPTRANLRVKYIELPILAKMPFVWGTYFAEGISFGFPVENSGLAPNLSRVTSPDVAVVIGGGYNLKKYLAVEFRYEGSLRQVNNTPDSFGQRGRSYMAIAKLPF